MNSPLESHIQSIGRQLLEQARVQEHGATKLDRRLQSLMQRMGDDACFRVQTLRFIDVLPTLRDDRDLLRHLQEYFAGEAFSLPPVLRWSLCHAGPAAHLVAPVMRSLVDWAGRHFIAGETAAQAWDIIRGLHVDGKGVSLDMLGEAVLSESEADAYQQSYLCLIDEMAPKMAGAGQRLNLSLKVSSLYSQLTPAAPEYCSVRIRERLRPIASKLRQCGGYLTLDMEHYDFRHITMQVFYDLLSEPDFADWSDVGIAMQAYLKRTCDDLQQLIRWVKARRVPIGVRLVRGAYWDMETVIARREAWDVPVWRNKQQTDQSYEQCIQLLLDHPGQIRPMLAGHNVRSIALAIALIEERAMAAGDYEFQMLYGMAEGLQAAVIARGHPLRIYLPVGPIIPGMAYLVRRFLENSSNMSFLRMAFIESRSEQALLQLPGGSGV